MTLQDEIRRIVREEIESARQRSVYQRYKMIRVDGVLSPSAGKVYVVPVDNEATFPEIVVNRRVMPTEDLEVVVGVDNVSNTRQVLDIFDGEIFDQDDYTGQTYQPLHAPDHGWTSQTTPPFNNPAADAVTVGIRGLYPLRARPAKGGGVKIDIAPHTYEFNDSFVVFSGADSYDLSGSVPSTAGQQRFTLVYLDKSNGQITLANGETGIYSKLNSPQWVTKPSGKIEPIALIRLYNGMTGIDEKYDIYDVRRVVGSAESDNIDVTGTFTITRTSTWLTEIKNSNSASSPRVTLAGGNSTSDNNFLAMVTPRYSNDTDGIDAGFQITTSFDCEDDIYRVNNYGLNMLVDADTGEASISTFAGSSDNGGDINFTRDDDTSILFIDDSTQYVGINETSPERQLHITGPDGSVTTLPTLGAKDLFLFENDGNVNAVLVCGSTNTGGIKFYKDGGSSFEAGIFSRAASSNIEFRTNGNNIRMDINSNGRVGIGTTSQAAILDVEQDGTTDAIPVLRLKQDDVSEEFIEFDTTIGTGNAIEAVGAKTLTTTHFLKVTIPGGLTRYIPMGTIA